MKDKYWDGGRTGDSPATELMGSSPSHQHWKGLVGVEIYGTWSLLPKVLREVRAYPEGPGLSTQERGPRPQGASEVRDKVNPQIWEKGPGAVRRRPCCEAQVPRSAEHRRPKQS